MDLLSNLPDDLVCHILSFLTTKDAASTSLLSKRWYNLFALVPNLDIEDTVFRYSNCMSSFISFVDRVIALHGDSPIKRFSVKCRAGHIDPCRVKSWISNVLQRGVSDLDLDNVFGGKIILPSNMFNSGTLVELKLRSYNSGLDWMTGREDTFLPMLKTLVFDLAFISCGKMEMCLRSFPVLEELSIGHTAWIVCDQTVSSETLRNLTIHSSSGFGGEDLLSIKSISFDTPRLVYFDYSDFVAEDYPKVNLTSVVDARLNLILAEVQFRQARKSRDDQDDVFLRFRNVWKLISGIRHVQKLFLFFDTLEVLSLRCESIPMFNNLKVLRIWSSEHRGWQAMPTLLRNCPLLETLVLEGLLHYVTDKCGDACDCVSRENKGRSLMSCPVKKLQINLFQGIKREVEMIKHFLDSFRCLKEMEIYARENRRLCIQVPREFELFNELYSCDVRFLVRGSLYKTWTAVNLTMNQVVKEDNLS